MLYPIMPRSLVCFMIMLLMMECCNLIILHMVVMAMGGGLSGRAICVINSDILNIEIFFMGSVRLHSCFIFLQMLLCFHVLRCNIHAGNH